MSDDYPGASEEFPIQPGGRLPLEKTDLIITEQQMLAELGWGLPSAQRVVAIAPHPDDEVFGCGGALTLYNEAGANVTVIIATDGARGGGNADPVLATAREGESRRAASMLGLAPPIFWRLPDRGLATDRTLVNRLQTAFDATDPDLVLLPAPTEAHPDHQALAHAGIAALVRHGGNRGVAFYEISLPLPRPTHLLDISSVETRKWQAMQCFETQLRELAYDRRIAGLNSYRAYHMGPGVSSAEAYVVVGLADLEDGLPALFEWPILYRNTVARNSRTISGLQQALHDRDARAEALQTDNDELRKQLSAFQMYNVALQNQLSALQAHAAALQAHADALQNQLAAHQGSLSWRITSPLRYLGGQLRQLRSFRTDRP